MQLESSLSFSRNRAGRAIRLVLAGDHPIVLDGLEILFRKEPDIEVLVRCSLAHEALQAIREHRPDVLILNLQMHRKNDLALMRQIMDENLPTRVVLLTANLGEDELLEVVRLGVSGVILNEMAPHLFVQCVRKVHVGEQWLEKRSFNRALEKLLQREADAREVARVLTRREIEVVRMVASGLSNKGIAEKLFISEGTVKSHLHHIFEKLHVTDREDLTHYALKRGLIVPSQIPN